MVSSKWKTAPRMNVESSYRCSSTSRRPAGDWPSRPATVEVKDLSAYYGNFRAIKNVSMDIAPNRVTAIIGPSGCGKSTLIRCLNRMHEVTPGARAEGTVLLDGEDIYGQDTDPVLSAPPRRHGLPAPQPVPDDVDLRQRRRRPAAQPPLDAASGR